MPIVAHISCKATNSAPQNTQNTSGAPEVTWLLPDRERKQESRRVRHSLYRGQNLSAFVRSDALLSFQPLTRSVERGKKGRKAERTKLLPFEPLKHALREESTKITWVSPPPSHSLLRFSVAIFFPCARPSVNKRYPFVAGCWGSWEQKLGFLLISRVFL